MLKTFVALGLLLSLFLLVGSITTTLWPEAGPVDTVMHRQQPSAAAEKRNLDFYPPLPTKLPDLNAGYIFNPFRQLGDADTGDGPAEPTVEAIMDAVTYVGSVISGKQRIGIIAYTVPDDNQRPGAVIRGWRQPVKAPPHAENKHAQLAPGEIFGGYTVAEVLPDRIVFKKNGLTVEKLLDVDKKRDAPRASLPRQRARRVQGRNVQSGPLGSWQRRSTGRVRGATELRKRPVARPPQPDAG